MGQKKWFSTLFGQSKFLRHKIFGQKKIGGGGEGVRIPVLIQTPDATDSIMNSVIMYFVISDCSEYMYHNL